MLSTQHAFCTSSVRSIMMAFDRLKQYDELSWLMQLELGARTDWLRRLQWIKMVDRLAAEEPLATDAESFANHYILPCDPLDLGATWVEAWRSYIGAAHKYHQPRAIVFNLSEHNDSLLELGGNKFCLFPEVEWSLRRAISHFGALDRFFNHLRDLSGDLRRDQHPFPVEVLTRFGLRTRDLQSKSARSKPAYLALMRFWLDEYLPVLQLEAAEFSHMPALPLALRRMRRDCLRRHARIEAAYRECSLDFERASSVYWQEVERLRQIAGHRH